jgi:hypothetical protein
VGLRLTIRIWEAFDFLFPATVATGLSQTTLTEAPPRSPTSIHGEEQFGTGRDNGLRRVGPTLQPFPRQLSTSGREHDAHTTCAHCLARPQILDRFDPTNPPLTRNSASFCVEHATLIDLIDHVDEQHLTDKRSIESIGSWAPTSEEVAAIVSEMRPIIDRFAARDQQRLAVWADAV